MRARGIGLFVAFFLLIGAAAAMAAPGASGAGSIPTSWVGPVCLGILALAYLLVAGEESFRLRKSVPVMIAAGLIWVLVCHLYARAGRGAEATTALRANLLEYAELLLFLLPAMTYVNTMEERQVFDALRVWLIRKRLSLRALFWVTGSIAFLISPVADNLTTALILGSVAVAVGGGNRRFVTPACISIVVAANAGGAFSPFGDITTLMVWQKGKLQFAEFFGLLIPALVDWLVPAAILSIAVGRERPAPTADVARLRPGALPVIALFAATIGGTVLLHDLVDLPAAVGMMTGLGMLKLYSAWLDRRLQREPVSEEELMAAFGPEEDPHDTFDVFRILEKVEWDTLMFFYGVILCVGGIARLGYLAALSHGLYAGMGPTTANVLVGLISAVVDNIPVMYAVLSMDPAMSHSQWLLATLTTGVGGSLISIGSAAGVALMGQARGAYTFLSHLRWAWAVALGYAAGILAHLLLHGR